MPKDYEVPYMKLGEIADATAERVADDHGFIAQVLFTLGVPSLGPGCTSAMLDIVDKSRDARRKLLDARAETTDPQTLEQIDLALGVLTNYRESLWAVCQISAHQQRATLDGLHGLLRTAWAVDEGLKPERADDLEMLLQLKALGNLGVKDAQ